MGRWLAQLPSERNKGQARRARGDISQTFVLGREDMMTSLTARQLMDEERVQCPEYGTVLVRGEQGLRALKERDTRGSLLLWLLFVERICLLLSKSRKPIRGHYLPCINAGRTTEE